MDRVVDIGPAEWEKGYFNPRQNSVTENGVLGMFSRYRPPVEITKGALRVGLDWPSNGTHTRLLLT